MDPLSGDETPAAQRSIDEAAQLASADVHDVPKSPGGVSLCYSCRRLGGCRMGIVTESLDDDGVVVSELSCSAENEGGIQVAHGGWTAGALDELVGHTTLLRGEFAVTGTLEVRFVKPVPIEVPLIGRAWIESRERRKVFVGASIELASSGAIVASAKAIMVTRDSDHFVKHQRWLQSQVKP